MNILFVSESIWMEGVVYDLHTMAEGLSLLGHNVYAIDPGEHSDEQSGSRKVRRVFPEASVHLRRPCFPSPTLLFGTFSIDSIPFASDLRKAYRRYMEISQFLREEKIDIIVLYSAARNGLQTVHLAKKHNIPVVFRNVDMLYNLWPNSLKRNLVKAIEKHIYPRMDMLLALTPKYAEYLIRFGADKEKVDLLLFPIDTSLFHPAVDSSDIRRRWGLDYEDQLIVFIGTLYEFGGLAEFTRQFPLVLRQSPRAKLLIVGDGPLRPILEEIVTELNLEKYIVITGYQPFSDIPQYVNAATVCLNVFPVNDRTKNIFSAKIIQYLSCGKATVSTSLPGITTLIPGESCGVIYSDTVNGIVEEIVDLMKSPVRRKHLEEVGLNYVKQAHDHHKIILRLEKTLKYLLTQRASKS